MSLFYKTSISIVVFLAFHSSQIWSACMAQTPVYATSEPGEAVAVKTEDVRKKDVLPLQTTPKMRSESKWLVFCMEKGHYLKNPISELDMREFLREYMKNLDFFKLFFTTEDVQHFQDFFAPSIDIYLRQGTLLPAFSIYGRFIERAKKRLEWIKKRMDEPFDLSSEDTFRPDRDKENWPKDDAEADELWNKRLKYDIENQMLGYTDEVEIDDGDLVEPPPDESKVQGEIEKLEEKSPKTFEEKLAKAKEEVLKRYERIISNYEKADSVEIQEVYLNTLARLYDPHSAFLSEYFLEEFDISVRNALVGIGAMLMEKDGYCIISELLPGGPAEKSKLLKPGDKIVAVGQETGEMIDTIGLKLRKTVKMIRGKSGTKVRLLVESPSNSSRKVITIVREEIKLTTKLASAEVFDIPLGNRTVPIGVIDLPAFYGENEDSSGFSTSKDVEELLTKLKKIGVRGIILDLRRNGGGFLNEAVDLAGLFIKTGPVLQVQNSNSEVHKLSDENPKIAWDGPLMILVSRMSASATEIVAGALKNHQRALIVGDKATHGKGTVQAVYHLDRFDPSQKSAAKVTIQKWYLPNGDSIQVRGVKPDIVLPSLYDGLEIGEEHKDYALKWDAITPCLIESAWGYGVPLSESETLLKTLGEKSKERQKTLEEFKMWNERVDRIAKRQSEKDISLKYEDRENKLKEDESFADKIEKEEKEFISKNYPKRQVRLDSAIENEKLSEKSDEQKKIKLKRKINGKTISVSDDDKEEDFDVQLREALRIMSDWIDLLDKSKEKRGLPKPDRTIAPNTVANAVKNN